VPEKIKCQQAFDAVVVIALRILVGLRDMVQYRSDLLLFGCLLTLVTTFFTLSSSVSLWQAGKAGGPPGVYIEDKEPYAWIISFACQV